MQNFVLEIMAKNNISPERYVDCKPLAIAGFVASSKTIASRILPADLNLITEDEESSKIAILDRLISDNAYSQAIFRAVAKYVKAAFEGNLGQFDTAEVLEFYNAFKDASPESQRADLIFTGRLCNDIVDAEVTRAALKDEELAASLEESENDFDSFLVKVADHDNGMLMYQMSDLYKFSSLMAVSLVNFHENRGYTLEDARDANRSTGFIMNSIYEQITNAITGDVLRGRMQRDLPERDFNIVEQLVLSENIESSQSVH